MSSSDVRQSQEDTISFKRGDICLVTPPGKSWEGRLALILRVDERRHCAEILLVHSSPELATDFDSVIDRSFDCAQYDVVLQSDLRGVVWINQIVKRVGHITPPVFTALNNIFSNEQEIPPPKPSVRIYQDVLLSRGLPLAGPVDRRWGFKEDEGIALRLLTADCTETLLASKYVQTPPEVEDRRRKNAREALNENRGTQWL
jgi:hypothetical protein